MTDGAGRQDFGMQHVFLMEFGPTVRAAATAVRGRPEYADLQILVDATAASWSLENFDEEPLEAYLAKAKEVRDATFDAMTPLVIAADERLHPAVAYMARRWIIEEFVAALPLLGRHLAVQTISVWYARAMDE